MSLGKDDNLQNIILNYTPVGERVVMPVGLDLETIPKQSIANVHCDNECATIELGNHSIVLPFDIIETVYNEMKLKRGE